MMQLVTIKHLTQNGKEGQHILITDVADLAKYFEWVGVQVTKHVSALLKSRVPPDRWDHAPGSNHGNSVFGVAVMMAKFKENNPIFNIDEALATKFDNCRKCINEFGGVLINMVGGYVRFDPSLHEVVLSEEYTLGQEREAYYVIKEGTKYINLENDPYLERHTKDWADKNDPNMSYVTNLREFSKAELTAIFQKFCASGGRWAYVYTTGSDRPQIREYCEALAVAGVDGVEFEFNIGIDPDLNNLMTELSAKLNMRIKYSAV